MVDPLRLGVGAVVLGVGVAAVARPQIVGDAAEALGGDVADLSDPQVRAVGVLLVLVGLLFVLGGVTF